MSMTPDLTRPLPQELLAQEYALVPGQPQNVRLNGRDITLQRTDAGLTVVSENRHAVVVRPVAADLYVVTGAAATHNPSEPESFEGALRIALERLALIS